MPLKKLAKQTERRDRLNARNEKIRAYYRKRVEGGYRNDFIIKELTDIYALDVSTLESIVYQRGVYKEF